MFKIKNKNYQDYFKFFLFLASQYRPIMIRQGSGNQTSIITIMVK